jgi:hypothetical protein
MQSLNLTCSEFLHACVLSLSFQNFLTFPYVQRIYYIFIFCVCAVLFVTILEHILSVSVFRLDQPPLLTRNKASVFFFILVVCIVFPMNGHRQRGRETDVHSVPLRPGSPGHPNGIDKRKVASINCKVCPCYRLF